MSFNDFFEEYKIRIKSENGKNIKKNYSNLDFVNKLFIWFFIAILACGLFIALDAFIKYFIQGNFHFSIMHGIFIAAIAIWIVWAFIVEVKIMNMDDIKKTTRSKMKVLVDLMKEYHLDYNDCSTIDKLIQEAEKAKNEHGSDRTIKAFNAGAGLLLPAVIASAIDKFFEKTDLKDLLIVEVITIVLIILFIYLSAILLDMQASRPFGKNAKYEDLIYSLRQLALFGYYEDQELKEEKTNESNITYNIILQESKKYGIRCLFGKTKKISKNKP